MPGMNGLDTTAEMRKLTRAQGFSLAQIADVDEALEIGRGADVAGRERRQDPLRLTGRA